MDVSTYSTDRFFFRFRLLALAWCAVLFAGACSGSKVERTPAIVFTIRSELPMDPGIRKAERESVPSSRGRALLAETPEKKKADGAPSAERKQIEVKYRALNRLEQPRRKSKHSSKASNASAAAFETNATNQANLVFGGEGFDIGRFERRAEEKLNYGYSHHLETRWDPSPVENDQDELDLAGDHMRSEKSLIFHSSPGESIRPKEPEGMPGYMASEMPVHVEGSDEAIRESKLLFHPDRTTNAVLLRSNRSIDLLSPNRGRNLLK